MFCRFNLKPPLLHKSTENLCSQKLGAGLYVKIKGECERHIHAQQAALQQLARTQDPATFLLSLNAYWNDYCQAMVLHSSLPPSIVNIALSTNSTRAFVRV
jgi:hypothetical protein